MFREYNLRDLEFHSSLNKEWKDLARDAFLKDKIYVMSDAEAASFLEEEKLDISVASIRQDQLMKTVSHFIFIIQFCFAI